MPEPFQFRRVNEITGTFVLLIIAILIAAVIWTGRSQRWFKSNVTFSIILPEEGAAGIRQGSEVYFLGTLVGSVSDVIVDTTGRMEAEVRIRRDFFLFVRADSSAVVKKKFGVAGDAFFEITRGVGKPLSEEDASIVCNEQFQSGLESAIEEIRREALLVLKKTTSGLEVWTELGASLAGTRQRLDQLTLRIDSIASGIQDGKGSIGQLLTEDAIADDVKQLFARANLVMAGAHSITTNLQTAASDLQRGAARLPEITDAVANEARDLPGLVQQTHTSMRELERLIEAMQRHWLVRRYMKETTPPTGRSLTEREEPAHNAFKAVRAPKSSK